jgi:hypothetical protein
MEEYIQRLPRFPWSHSGPITRQRSNGWFAASLRQVVVLKLYARVVKVENVAQVDLFSNYTRCGNGVMCQWVLSHSTNKGGRIDVVICLRSRLIYVLFLIFPVKLKSPAPIRPPSQLGRTPQTLTLNDI